MTAFAAAIDHKRKGLDFFQGSGVRSLNDDLVEPAGSIEDAYIAGGKNTVTVTGGYRQVCTVNGKVLAGSAFKGPGTQELCRVIKGPGCFLLVTQLNNIAGGLGLTKGIGEQEYDQDSEPHRAKIGQKPAFATDKSGFFLLIVVLDVAYIRRQGTTGGTLIAGQEDGVYTTCGQVGGRTIVNSNNS